MKINIKRYSGMHKLCVLVLACTLSAACEKQSLGERHATFANLQTIDKASESGASEVANKAIPDESRKLDRWPQLDIAVKKDDDIENKIRVILSSMTLEQKVAQIIQPEIRDVSIEDMRQYGFGSYLNGGGSFPNTNKHSSVQDWIDLAEAMYQASIDDSIDGSTIPTMWGTDAVHGHNNVIGATIYPHNIGLGAANDPELIRRIAQATAQEVMATGIDWVFAPTVAVVRDDRWGRSYEGYSENPDITRAYSAAIVEGLQGKLGDDFLADDRVIATVKHFVGDGGTIDGDDQGNNIASEQELIDLHAQGYFSGLSVGAQTVMASFNSWHGEKMHGHKYMLTDVLKGRLGFDGLVVGDWNGHGQVQGCTNSSCPQAVNAGMDILMAPTSTWKNLYENTISQVREGEITMERIDDAVLRILRVKMRAGLFEKRSPKQRPLSGQVELIGSKEHREIAREAVRKSLVLLKNKNNILPLNPKKRIYVTGDGADNIGKQSGGWTITWQGTNNINSDFPGGSSIYDGIKKKVEQAGGSVELGQGADFNTVPDVAIVVFGEEPYAEGNGDLDNLEYQRGDKEDLAILKALKSKGIPVISLFISGRPLWVNPELNQSDAFVAIWLPGSEGGAVSDLIFTSESGALPYDFHGKLSYSWPQKADQFSLNIHDEEYDPLLPYGFGLSYLDENILSDKLDEQATDTIEAQISARAIFAAGAKKPWHLELISNQNSQLMSSNVVETPALRVRTIDRNIQEDALQLVWSSTTSSTLKIAANFPEDLRAYAESKTSLRFDVLRKNEVKAPIYIGFGDTKLDLSDRITALSTNEWKTISIDIQCFAALGADLGSIFTAFEIESSGELSLQLSEVWLKPFSTSSADIQCPN